MLTPNDILEMKFSSKLRGYNEDEVNDFLDTVKFEFENILMENDKLKNESLDLKKQIDLKNSQMESDDYLEKVKKANVMIEKARNASEQYINDAQVTAERIIAAASNKAVAIETFGDPSSQASGYKNKAASINQSELESYLLDLKEKAELLYEKSEQTAKLIIADAEAKADDIRNKAMTFNDTTIRSIAIKESADKKIKEAEDKAADILENARSKATDIEKIMNIQISNSKQRLNEIEDNIQSYKAKLDNFMSGYNQLLGRLPKSLDNIDVTDRPSRTTTQKTSSQTSEPIQNTEKDAIDIDGVSGLKQSGLDKIKDNLKNLESTVNYNGEKGIKSINPVVDFTDIAEDTEIAAESKNKIEEISEEQKIITDEEKDKLQKLLDDII